MNVFIFVFISSGYYILLEWYIFLLNCILYIGTRTLIIGFIKDHYILVNH